jgi:hypothetical protein
MISFPKHGIPIESRFLVAKESLGLENEHNVAVDDDGGEDGHERLDVRGRKYLSHGTRSTTSTRAATY